MAKMRETPVRDAYVHAGTVRADGQMVHDFYLFQVKSPSESKYAWDYLKVLRTIPAAEAYRPLSESRCKLVKQG